MGYYDDLRAHIGEQLADYTRRIDLEADRAVDALRGFPRHREADFQAARRLCEKWEGVASSLRRVLAAIDRAEAHANVKQEKQSAEQAQWLADLEADRVPAKRLEEAARHVLTNIGGRVDGNINGGAGQLWTGRAYLSGDDAWRFVGSRLRGRVADDDLAVLDAAARTKQAIDFVVKSHARAFLRGHDTEQKKAG